MTNNDNTTALAVRNNMTAMELVGNVKNVEALGAVFAQSGFFGEVTQSVATAALVNCLLEGLSPVQYRAKYHTFDNGQTGIKSDYVQRRFHALGGTWEFVEWSGDVCDVAFTYGGKTHRGKVTLDEMRSNGVAVGKGGQLKTNWAKFPKQMLWARCASTYIRAICPEALEGNYTQEEVADFAPRTEASVTVSPSPVAAEAVEAEPVEAEEIDYGVCPCGSVKGKRWSAIDTATLKKILATPASKAKALTAEHRNEIVAELGYREEEAEAESEQ